MEVSFQGKISTPTTPVISAPVRKSTCRGARLDRSYAGETTLAAMLTLMVATSTVTRAYSRPMTLSVLPASSTGSQMASP